MPGAPPVMTTTNISTVTTCALGWGALGSVEHAWKSPAGAEPDLLFTTRRVPVTGVIETSNSKIAMVLPETSRQVTGPGLWVVPSSAAVRITGLGRTGTLCPGPHPESGLISVGSAQGSQHGLWFWVGDLALRTAGACAGRVRSPRNRAECRTVGHTACPSLLSPSGHCPHPAPASDQWGCQESTAQSRQSSRPSLPTRPSLPAPYPGAQGPSLQSTALLLRPETQWVL